MATATRYFRGTIRADDSVGDQCIELREIGWKGYSTMLRLRSERRRPRMIYLDGDLFLMSPSHIHEFAKERFGWFVHVVVEELAIDCHPAGQTTFRRRAKRGGLEGNLTYYLANEPRVRGSGGRDLNLRHDPPPDLAIEVVHTHAADAAVDVYCRLGVPELWLWEDGNLRILLLQADGRYAESATSAAFPFLSAAEITAWIAKPQDVSESRWSIELRRWVRETLLPRGRGAALENPTP